MDAGKKSWPRRFLGAALGCAVIAAASGAHAEEQRFTAAEPCDPAVALRSPLHKDVAVEPPAAVLRFNVPGLIARERAWDVAAHASVGNDVRFQRALFLSAHLRF